MTPLLKPAGRPMLIGSQPLADHDQATRLVLDSVPEIPNWVQLPMYKREGMIPQFAPGLPGLVRIEDRVYVDASRPGFDGEMAAFYEAYLAAAEPSADLGGTPFALTDDIARGFFALLGALSAGRPPELFAVKGQITGPITFCTGLIDQDRRAIFYNDALRDAAVKMIALKAAWQVEQLARFGVPVIIFVDEPALAGYGSSEFISISREHITQCLTEVVEAVHAKGAAAGVHVCANTDWSLLFDARADIVNFDAFEYFDKFILYGPQIRAFLGAGGCLAWGMVPTAQPEQVRAANLEALLADWKNKSAQVAALGIAPDSLLQQSFITPACGTGSLPPDLSLKVLALTRELSRHIRAL